MSVSAYRQARLEGQGVVRTAVLDAAKRLLVEEGPAALTVRSIAAAAGCSTKVIYTLFGGKEGLGEALWMEGFARFEQRLRAIPPHDDPLVALRAGLEAYREYALAEPEFYRVMFMGALPAYRPGPQAAQAAKRTFDILVDGVHAGLEAGVLRGPGAVEIADVLWMGIHGAVSLEISCYFEGDVAAQRYRLLCASLLAPFLTTDERTTS